MGLLLTGEVARSEAKFTRSGSWQKSLIFFIFTRHPWFRACETSPTAAHKQCGVGLWVGYSSLGQRQKKHTQMQKDLLLFEKRFSLQKSKKKKKKVALSSECHHAAGFHSFWLLGYCATNMRMSDGDIRRTKSRRSEDMALRRATKSACLKVQTEATKHAHSAWFLFPKMQHRLRPWRRTEIDKQLWNTLAIIAHIVAAPLCK